jgi:preprotein translocase subunit SecB
MRPSYLRLEFYYVEELSFSVQPKYEFDSKKQTDILINDLRVKVEPHRHFENPSKWYFELQIKSDDKVGKLPYIFSIKMDGFFAVSEECPPDLVDQLALTNAPAILYSAARELLAIVTGRGQYLSIDLPSVTFLEPPKIKATRTAATKAKSVRTSKKAPKKAASK